jgi:dihydroorotate dehydrogenase
MSFSVNLCWGKPIRFTKAVYEPFWRSVFERRAPTTLAYIEANFSTPIKQGNFTREISDELLDALTQAYKEAVGRPIAIENNGE